MSDADSRVALVTGSARRIGAEISRCLHDAGYRIGVHYHKSEAEAASLAAALNATRPRSAKAFPLDLNQTSQLADLVEDCVTEFGSLDLLVNNASTFYPTRLEDTQQTDFDDLIGVNLKAPLFLAKAAAPHLSTSGGSVVNIADIYGERPLTGHSVYCVAKAGLIMLTRALAVELGPEVRVNAVAPGAILWPESGGGEKDRDAVISRTTLGRLGKPEEIARAVLFLARDATYSSGEILAVDGGRSSRY